MSLWNIFTNAPSMLQPGPSPSVGGSPALEVAGSGPIYPNDVPGDLVSMFPRGLTFEVEAPWTNERPTFDAGSTFAAPAANVNAGAPSSLWGSLFGGGTMNSFWDSLFGQADSITAGILPILRESNRASEARAVTNAQLELARLAAARGQTYQLSGAATTPALLPWEGTDLKKYLPLVVVLVVLMVLKR